MPPPGRIVQQGNCDVWVASLTEFAGRHADLDGMLVPLERAAVESSGQRGPVLRLSRALLRLLLARYLGQGLDEIEIDRRCRVCGQPHGKPRVAGDSAHVAPGFSVAHSGDLVVLAFAAGALVGVDVERVLALQNTDDDLLDYALAADERNRVQDAPGETRATAFLHHWTGKEAVLKALGTGLEVDPGTVPVPAMPAGGRVTVTLPGTPAPVTLWVRGVDVGAGYVCSLAATQQLRDVQVVCLSPTTVLGGLPSTGAGSG